MGITTKGCAVSSTESATGLKRVVAASMVTDRLASTETVTVYDPGTPFAVNSGEVATPFTSVMTWTDVAPNGNVPPAPPTPGVRVNVRMAPAIGSPAAVR